MQYNSFYKLANFHETRYEGLVIGSHKSVISLIPVFDKLKAPKVLSSESVLKKYKSLNL
jgi:hypothetical protein